MQSGVLLPGSQKYRFFGVGVGSPRFCGAGQFGALQGAASTSFEIRLEGKDESKSTTFDGFQVRTTSTPVIVSILVALGPSAQFGLLFNYVSEYEAISIAQKFDWKRMRALLT